MKKRIIRSEREKPPPPNIPASFIFYREQIHYLILVSFISGPVLCTWWSRLLQRLRSDRVIGARALPSICTCFERRDEKTHSPSLSFLHVKPVA